MLKKSSTGSVPVWPSVPSGVPKMKMYSVEACVDDVQRAHRAAHFAEHPLAGVGIDLGLRGVRAREVRDNVLDYGRRVVRRSCDGGARARLTRPDQRRTTSPGALF
jgi:hypothetical protein